MSLKLSVSEIWKNYNGNPVLRGCSFTFNKSGVYILRGPNGSGKSTFLRICSLLEEPDSGEISYSSDDFLINKDMALKRRITLVLPGIGAFNTTVFKNAAYGLRLRRLNRKELNKRTEKALDFVNLLNKKNQHALTLSSGEMQRLGIARALAIEPDILFLDEPTAFIDSGNTEIIEDVILKMKRDGHPAVIMSTHDAAQAKRLADRLLSLQDGRIFEL